MSRVAPHSELGTAFLSAEAERIARLCHQMAERFGDGGRLVAFGASPQARSDVRHVTVEFVHPVIVGKRALPARGLYSASKFAVEGWSQAIRAELAKDGVDVLVVCPGLTQTNFSQNMIEQKALVKMDHLRGMTPEEVAEATLRTLERGTREVTLTLQGRLLVLVSRFFPRLADRIAQRTVRRLFREEIEARRAAAAPSV